jgi:serine/threonine protein kinase
MHEQNVAHRDITIGNIMMDASELFPEGFHPVRQNLSRNGLTEVVGIMRTHAPVRYYLIDFDAAIAFEKGTPVHHKFAEGKAGRDDEVPEFKSAMPYDPFKVDIFQFGNLLRKEILQVCPFASMNHDNLLTVLSEIRRCRIS